MDQKKAKNSLYYLQTFASKILLMNSPFSISTKVHSLSGSLKCQYLLNSTNFIRIGSKTLNFNENWVSFWHHANNKRVNWVIKKRRRRRNGDGSSLSARVILRNMNTILCGFTWWLLWVFQMLQEDECGWWLE